MQRCTCNLRDDRSGMDAFEGGVETTKPAQWKACPEAVSPQDTPDARIPESLTARLHRRDDERPFPTTKNNFSANRPVDAVIGLS